MLMTDDALDTLKKLLPKARQKPLDFGLCMGKKPENNILIVDLVKPSATLMRQAKKAGETAKLTRGTCEISGKVMTLTCEEDIPPGLTKSMKKFMTEIGMTMRVTLLDANGTVVDAEDDADDQPPEAAPSPAAPPAPDTAEASAAPAEDDTDPQAQKWRQVEAALGAHVERFSESGDPRAATVAKAWQGAADAAGRGEYKAAMGVAAKLKPILTAAAAPTAPPASPPPSAPTETAEPTPAAPAPPSEATDPAAANWAKVQTALEALYTKAMGNNPANRSQLTAAWAMATEKAETGDFKTALAIAAKLKPALETAAAAAKAGTEDEIPKDVVAFQKSRVIWANTRSMMLSEMKKLEGAIVAACGSDPELAEVAGDANKLTRRLDVFDTRLETILDRMTETPEGDDRTKLKREAAEAIAAYQTALQDDFFKDVDANNGFANVAIAGVAVKSLDSIAKVLAA